ncbi:uncharacterized protein LOC107227145 [Neodiprion lecontei]|uniref:Uncharacterized protein LOC107227145 n=1 Tax=Neodiprion lecontei TaxID=441921 RepID=A0A6J0CBW8_NEOLC|nr:uncharacterized protein LOC107227145 [Neodiprion lecontei]XP_046591283.1 uncharacterized protein LOC107227145 [Neodiprion lecontei]
MFSILESRMMIIYQVTVILSLNALLVQCAPFLHQTTDGSWDENMVDCSPGGRCWEYLQRQELPAKQDYYKDPLRLQSHRDQNSIIAQPSLDTLPPTNRIAKKGVFTSRGWGAGGMPFSVLYMNPHSSRSNSNTGANEIEPVRALPLESPALLPPPRHSTNRVALRNGASGRRQYSIIPQLFVSYGWGPLGK